MRSGGTKPYILRNVLHSYVFAIFDMKNVVLAFVSRQLY